MGQHEERLNSTIWIYLNHIKTVIKPLHLNNYFAPINRQVEALEQIVDTIHHVSAPDTQITPSPAVIRHANDTRKAAKSRCPRSRSKRKYKVLQPGLQWQAEQSAMRAAAAAPSLVSPPSGTRPRPALARKQASTMGAAKIPTPLTLSTVRILTEKYLK